MPLSPMDIHDKEFSRSFRGYNQDEVDDFLERIIHDYESLIRQNSELQLVIDQMKEKNRSYSNLEDALSQSIRLAQDAADEIKSNARKEAELITKGAQSNAGKVLSDAQSSMDRILSDAQSRADKIISDAQGDAENTRKEAEWITRETQTNADKILADSQSRADKIISDALEQSSKITHENEDMQKRAAMFRAQFRSLIQSQLAMMGSMEWDKFDLSIEPMACT